MEPGQALSRGRFSGDCDGEPELPFPWELDELGEKLGAGIQVVGGDALDTANLLAFLNAFTDDFRCVPFNDDLAQCVAGDA